MYNELCYSFTLASKTFNATMNFHQMGHMINHDVHVWRNVCPLVTITFYTEKIFNPLHGLWIERFHWIIISHESILLWSEVNLLCHCLAYWTLSRILSRQSPINCKAWVYLIFSNMEQKIQYILSALKCAWRANMLAVHGSE